MHKRFAIWSWTLVRGDFRLVPHKIPLLFVRHLNETVVITLLSWGQPLKIWTQEKVKENMKGAKNKNDSFFGDQTDQSPFNSSTFYSNRKMLSLEKTQYCQFLGVLTQLKIPRKCGGEIFNSGIWEIWIWNFLYSYFQPAGSSVCFFWDEKQKAERI